MHLRMGATGDKACGILGKSRLAGANSQAVQQTPSSKGHLSNHAMHCICPMLICLVRLCTKGGGAALVVFLISSPRLDQGHLDLSWQNMFCHHATRSTGLP